jgi:hypothetical protein
VTDPPHIQIAAFHPHASTLVQWIKGRRRMSTAGRNLSAGFVGMGEEKP